jgi:hypothetical protein
MSKNKVAVFGKQKISHDSLMEEALQGAFKAVSVFKEILADPNCEPRDRIAAAKGAMDTYVKLAGLVEIDSVESLPVLRAIGNAGN